MKYNQKIKAFTITEMVIVIVISAIVAGLAFTVLSVVQKNMTSIGENYEYKTTMQQLEQALAIDMNAFTDMEWDDKTEMLKFSSPIRSKTYRFFKDSIVSDLGKFPIKTLEKQFYQEGEIVQSGKIDAVKLNFSKTNDFHRIFAFKYNDVTIHF